MKTKLKTQVMPTDRKTLDFRIEVKAVDVEKRTFRARFTTYDLDLVDDKIAKGAYTRTLQNWRDSKARTIYLLDNHRYTSVFDSLGHLLEAYEEDEGVDGLFYVSKGAKGDELLEKIKDGTIREMSIGYDVVKWEWEDLLDEVGNLVKRVRHIKELRLYEVSVVLWGANPYTAIDISSVKSLISNVRGKNLSEIERKELTDLHEEITALLEVETEEKAEEPAGEPDNTEELAEIEEKRIELERELVSLALKALGTP